MRVDPKPFYADLFSKRADAPAEAPPAAPRPDAPAQAPESPRGVAGGRNGGAEGGKSDAGPAPGSRPAPRYRALPAPPGTAPEPDAVQPARPSPLAELIGDVDVHRLTPRQMADLSLDLYAAGALSFDDYAALAFQPELHPDFQRTIGALTGERPEPDRPRDYVQLWEERLAFQRRHDTRRPDLIEQAERIAQVLRRIDRPTDVVV